MNIFVTGFTGKVGSRFVPRILQRGHRVKLLVRDAAKADRLREQGAEVVVGDLLQPDQYIEALRGIDVVVHLAAQFRGVDEHTTRTCKLRWQRSISSRCVAGGSAKICFRQHE